jgi:peptidoglycan/LPS O-acetylase OafA/YrhL
LVFRGFQKGKKEGANPSFGKQNQPKIAAMANTRFYSLDGLRAVCALSVALCHCELLFGNGVIFCHGYLAVDMFFMLSGFVISGCYDARFAAGLGARDFLVARVRRLAPVYWGGLGLCIVAAMLCLPYERGNSPFALAVSGLMAAFLIPVFGPATFAYPANSVAWTLLWELIVNFAYAGWMRRLTSRGMLAVAVILLLPAIAFAGTNSRAWSFGMTGMDLWFGGLRAVPEFLIGVLLNRAYKSGHFARLPAMTPMVPLTAWLAVAVLPQGLPVLLDAGVAILVCPLLIALLVRGEVQTPRWFGVLGAMSYPLYASHLAWIGLAQQTPFFGLKRHPDPLLACGLVAVAILGSWVLYLTCDPARKVPKNSVPGAGFGGFPSPSPDTCEAQPKSV